MKSLFDTTVAKKLLRPNTVIGEGHSSIRIIKVSDDLVEYELLRTESIRFVSLDLIKSLIYGNQ